MSRGQTVAGETRSLETVSEDDAAGMARLEPLPNSGSVAFVGRRGPDWTCGVCGVLVFRQVPAGAFAAIETVVACLGCGVLNKLPCRQASTRCRPKPRAHPVTFGPSPLRWNGAT